MEREQITREDFEVVRKGWDPDAVRAHLSDVAAAFPEPVDAEAVAAEPERSLGDVAAARVRGVLEAAELAAADIQSGSQADADKRLADADAEAERILADARAEASAVLDGAKSEADGHVAAAKESVEELVSQAEVLLTQVSGLGERISASAPVLSRPSTGGAAATATVAEVPSGPVIVPEPTPPTFPEPTPDPVPEPTPDPTPDPMPEPIPEPTPDPVPEPTPDPAPEPTPEPELPATAAGDATTTEQLIAQLRASTTAAIASNGDATVVEQPSTPVAISGSDLGAARLVAMNMALEGASRDQINSQLRNEFGQVAGVEAMLDDVLARAGR